MKIPTVGSPRKLLQTAKVGGYPVKVYWDSDDITLEGNGFTMVFSEKPNLPPGIKRDRPAAAALLEEEKSLGELSDIGERWRAEVQRRIRHDWGTECFVADAAGFWQHPVYESTGNEFLCIQCDQVFPAAIVAANLWHCPDPNCNGSPMDIHAVDNCAWTYEMAYTFAVPTKKDLNCGDAAVGRFRSHCIDGGDDGSRDLRMRVLSATLQPAVGF